MWLDSQQATHLLLPLRPRSACRVIALRAIWKHQDIECSPVLGRISYSLRRKQVMTKKHYIMEPLGSLQNYSSSGTPELLLTIL